VISWFQAFAFKRNSYRYIGEVPLDPAIRETSDDGRPIAVSRPDSEVARLYAAMAKRLIEKTKPFEEAEES
jgi:ATP-binding protein involved in chromosome partitioning